MSALEVAVAITALGCAISGGVFFAFSNFVMAALDDLGDEPAAAAMNAINSTVINPAFMTALFGTGVAGVAVAAWALATGADGQGWFAAGGMLYAVGNPLVTAQASVPLNNALAGGGRWADFNRPWTHWNTVRTMTALSTVALFNIGLAQGA